MGEEAFLGVCRALRDNYAPTVAYILCRDPELPLRIQRVLADLPLIVAVNTKAAGKEFSIQSLKKSGMLVHHIDEALDLDLAIMPQARELLLSAHASQLFKLQDRVLCIISTNIESWAVFDVANLRNNRLREILRNRVDLEVVEAVLDLTTELLREGKEGAPVGALFVVGDLAQVTHNSREGIANPFHGHPEKIRTVLDRKNWHTIKNFASLDGACLVDDDGNVSAAGRYINVGHQWSAFLKGLGGRHSAALVISSATKAVAVCASAEGRVSLFIDGKTVYSLQIRG